MSHESRARPGGEIGGDRGSITAEHRRAELDELLEAATLELRLKLEWLLEYVIPEDDPSYMKITNQSQEPPLRQRLPRITPP